MDVKPEEISAIIQAAPGLIKSGAELAGALKLTQIAKAILGPATDEFAERIRDEVRLYRFGRQLELLRKAEKMVEDAGFTPKAVPIKLLFPLLEGASLEEDESLHDMWAALLANAASPDCEKVRPGFIATLKQMARDEAVLLNAVYESANGKREALPVNRKIEGVFFLGDEIADIAKASGESLAIWYICLERLQACMFLQRRFDSKHEVYMVTGSAFRFVEACCPPKRKENA
jgi:hypothetical protein